MFENLQDGFRVIVYSKEADSVVSGAVNDLLELIRGYSGQGKLFFVEKLQAPDSTIQRWLSKLQKGVAKVHEPDNKILDYLLVR